MTEKRYKFTGVVNPHKMVVAESDKKGSVMRFIPHETVESFGLENLLEVGSKLTFEVIFQYDRPTYGFPIEGDAGTYQRLINVKALTLLV